MAVRPLYKQKVFGYFCGSSNGVSGFEVVVREAGSGFLRVCGRGFGPSQWWVRHRVRG